MDSEAEWIDLNTGSTQLLAMRLRKASYLLCVIVNSPENSIDDSTSIISYRVGVRIKWVFAKHSEKYLSQGRYHIRAKYYTYIKYTILPIHSYRYY